LRRKPKCKKRANY